MAPPQSPPPPQQQPQHHQQQHQQPQHQHQQPQHHQQPQVAQTQQQCHQQPPTQHQSQHQQHQQQPHRHPHPHHHQTPPTRANEASSSSTGQQDMDLASVGGENGKSGASPPGSYTRIPPRSTDQSAVPPILPPHLLQVILNNPDKTNATILPQPNHVMLNHLYALSIKDGIMVLSATHRFKKKYVTTLLYKPI